MLTLRETLQMPTENLLIALRQFLYEHGYSSVTHDDINYVYGQPGEGWEIPVLMVAHCDTVHSKLPEVIAYNEETSLLWSPQGLGADDRAGVWAIVEMIRVGHRPFVLFTNGEETGGWGATAAADTLSRPPVNYIVELDRRGRNDAVFYGCKNQEFINFVTEEWWEEKHGSFSDISILCPRWQLCGVNLSIGYENEHTYKENLKISTLLYIISQVIKLINKKSAPFEWMGRDYSYLCEHNHKDNSYKNENYYDVYFCAMCETEFIVESGESAYCPTCQNDDMRTIIKQ